MDPGAYPLPVIEDLIIHLEKAKHFSAFDLSSGFHQSPMDSDKLRGLIGKICFIYLDD